ncbi:contact-dependent growth inhibition system immunity protein [Pseudomonas sp. R84]
MCESARADDIIKSFIADSEEVTLLDVAKEIETLLALNLTETDLRSFLLKEIGCCYCYWHEWPNGIEWLDHVKLLLKKRR